MNNHKLAKSKFFVEIKINLKADNSVLFKLEDSDPSDAR
jgi:hypothetical protein